SARWQVFRLGVSDPLVRSGDFSRSVAAETAKAVTTNCLATFAAYYYGIVALYRGSPWTICSSK
ncbi:MAG: hypothetical protein WBD79_06915, partial [Anaerolineae bacterium]